MGGDVKGGVGRVEVQSVVGHCCSLVVGGEGVLDEGVDDLRREDWFCENSEGRTDSGVRKGTDALVYIRGLGRPGYRSAHRFCQSFYGVR